MHAWNGIVIDSLVVSILQFVPNVLKNKISSHTHTPPHPPPPPPPSSLFVVVVVYRQRRIHSSRVKGIEIPLRMETFRYKSKTKIKFSKPIAKLLSKIYYSQPIRAIVCLKYSFRAPHFAFQVHICATNHDAKS